MRKFATPKFVAPTTHEPVVEQESGSYTFTFRTVTMQLKSKPGIVLNNPKEALNYLRPIYGGLDEDREHVVMLALDVRSQVVGMKVVSTGGQAHAQVDFKVLFRDVFALGGASFVISHNHPSGAVDPSPQDIKLTFDLRRAGEIMHVQMLDHLIVGHGSEYYSFSEKAAKERREKDREEGVTMG